MEEIIKVHEQYYILASSPRADDTARVLKCGETFAIFDHYGDIRPIGLGEEGLYHEGTRFLSQLSLQINRRLPLVLSSTVRDSSPVTGRPDNLSFSCTATAPTATT